MSLNHSAMSQSVILALFLTSCSESGFLGMGSGGSGRFRDGGNGSANGAGNNPQQYGSLNPELINQGGGTASGGPITMGPGTIINPNGGGEINIGTGEITIDNNAAITVTALRVDGSHDDVVIDFKKPDGTWQSWRPANKGNSTVLDGYCRKGFDCALDLRANSDGQVHTPQANSSQMMGLAQPGASVAFGYENGVHHDAGDYHSTDDIILLFSVNEAKSITILNLKMTGSPCTLDNWVKDRGCGGI